LNVVDLARALAGLAGLDEIEATAGVARLAACIGEADHLVCILADGLGMALLAGLPADSLLVRRLRAELRTVFPSSSATALTTFATGAWPGRHGVTGQWTHLPEIQATADLLRFAARTGPRSLARLGLTVEQAFPLPALMRGMRRDVLALFPEGMVNGIAATYFSGQRTRHGYRTLPQAMAEVVARVEAATAPTYTYLYTPWIDAEAHRHGVAHPAVQGAVVGLAREVERLVTRLNGRARIVLSADHGLLDTPIEARHWLKPSPDLFAALRVPPSGDSRVMYLHPRPGAEERLRASFQARYGDRFFVISREEAEAAELFGPGPLAPHARSRLGELIVISAGVDVLEYFPAGGLDRALVLNSHHSGLTPAEMLVPLVIV
jgi:predicted AlkP superfamily pyrophosphatase or phosphodiesterase